MSNGNDLEARHEAQLRTPTSLGRENKEGILAELAESNVLCADVFARYIKSQNSLWHVSGPQFRDGPPIGFPFSFRTGNHAESTTLGVGGML